MNISIPVIDPNTKSIDLSAWGGIDGFLAATSGGTPDTSPLRKIVPWLNKAHVLTGNAVSQLPYIMTRAGKELDPKETKAAWGAVKAPQTLMYKVASALCSGAAYVLPDVTSRAIIDLRYLAPSTITPQFDPKSGDLIYFQRSFHNKNENIMPNNMIYFWLPDDTVEIGAAQITPSTNAILSAGLLASMDKTLKTYGDRGFVPPMYAVAEGMPNKAELERAENVLSMMVRGLWERMVKIVNSKSLIPQKLGAGMEELKGVYLEITRQQIENIGAAYGIPSGIFMSDKAYATEMDALIQTWYTSGVFVTLYQTIEDVLNQQLWYKFDIEAKFDLQRLQAFQKEESDQSTSLASLSSTFTKYPEASIIAAGILGYDLTDEQIADIEALEPEDEPTPDPSTPDALDAPQDNSMDLPSDEENQIAEEMTKWRSFAEKPRKREFDVKHIPPAMAERIRAGLRSAKSQDEITAVFDSAVKGIGQDDTALRELAAAIEKAVQA